MGLIPEDVLPILREESAFQFDTKVYWTKQILDENGKPVRDKAGNPTYDIAGTTQLDARVVRATETFFNQQGMQIVIDQRIYVPALTGVRAGDRILSLDIDPASPQAIKSPPIVDVREMPTAAESVFELIRTASATATAGAPLGT